nr:unnamed protein product [Digitaria exilis]
MGRGKDPASFILRARAASARQRREWRGRGCSGDGELWRAGTVVVAAAGQRVPSRGERARGSSGRQHSAVIGWRAAQGSGSGVPWSSDRPRQHIDLCGEHKT